MPSQVSLENLIDGKRAEDSKNKKNQKISINLTKDKTAKRINTALDPK
jgi:hypothetical protein